LQFDKSKKIHFKMTSKYNLLNGNWILVFGILPLISLAQTAPKFNLSQIKAKYPDADMVYLNRVERINIELKDGKPLIESTHQQDRLFMNDRASVWADDRVNYSEAFQTIKDLKAISFIPTKTGLTANEITDIKTEKPSPGGGIFYDDSFVKKFTYTGAKQGGVGAMTYKEITANPYMLGGFLFGSFVPTLNAEFSVTFPLSVKVSYKSYGDIKNVSFSQSTSNGKTTYSWKMLNAKELPIENESLSMRYYATQIYLFIESYTANGQTTDVLGSVPKLFNYYKTLVKDLNQKPDADLKTLTDSLTKNKDELGKIRAIYYWVQDHIKYVAFEEGLGGFVPRQAADVCRKRYGDCKDMASLLTSMLQIAGIDAKLVWIGTRDIPFKYAENPSMAVDNHMIAALKYKGEWQFLDATDDRIDFGLPTTHIQGKEAMIMLGNSYEIVTVPVVVSTQNTKRDSIVLSWNGRTLVGNGVCEYEGQSKGYIKTVTQYLSESKRVEYFQNLLGRGSNKCNIEKNTIVGYEKRDVPLRFEYVFKVPDYVQQVGNEIFINTNLVKTWADKRIEASRKTDIKYDHKWSENNVIVLPIPADYVVTNLPPNAFFSNPEFSFEVKYEQKNNQVLIHNKLILNTILLKKSKFGEWNKMIDTLTDSYNETISLRKK
jgi:Transglutaminase-like superfamily/Domain of Unknown Function with PDB structure (DUF3857)